ncbi:NmrA family NAD(P)-binding protein [Mesorhizobium australafricanum]|uniref:NmrA family NAD(P)-binding protein n=1 Tax=Mesorhizobium australafricanum TaxID=3072311 RepID=A0ABU4X756_9HYPH|nr:NmrA family NAD(P)-binding protein [Mesorhizobium sp. VK3E]MDX8443348.1 NmrA family NAD(P)-binding protein [Mesorhizobium sp. VK3E]
MGKTLVLGATGSLAGLTAKYLCQQDASETLRVTTSREKNLQRLSERFAGAEAVVADWYDEGSLAVAMQDVSRVLVVTPDFTTDETVVTPNIVKAARKAGTVELLLRLLAIPPGLTASDLPQEFRDTRCGANLHVIAKPLLDMSGLPVCYVNVPAWIMFNLSTFFAAEIKSSRRMTMPAVTDANRMWVSEHDIAAVMAKVLSEPAARHVGREYALTAAQRYAYADVALLFSERLGEPIAYVDDDKALRASMGDDFDRLMTYFRHETEAYRDVVHRDTVPQLLGRPQQTLGDYIEANRRRFE